MPLWKCGSCGCMGIADSLNFCPICFEEPDVSAATHSKSDGSNHFRGHVTKRVPPPVDLKELAQRVARARAEKAASEAPEDEQDAL